MRPRPVLAALAALCLALPRSPLAQVPVAIELVLAVDTSASVSDAEFSLQMQGVASAFRSPDVIELIGSHDGVAVALFQWAGTAGGANDVPWRLLTGAASVRAGTGTWTPSSSSAVNRAVTSLTANRFAGRRLRIDVSGDGQNNAGDALFLARMRAREAGVTINGLAILTDVRTLGRYYREHVIDGAGAFVIEVADYEGFAEAMRVKLLRELAPPDLAGLGRP